MTPPDLAQPQRLDLEEGKRLLSEATPGEWTQESTDTDLYVGLPFPDEHVLGLQWVRGIEGDSEAEVQQADNDAALMVWLRNNADALIAAAEREQAREEWKQQVLMPALTEWREKVDAIAAALTPPESLSAQQETYT